MPRSQSILPKTLQRPVVNSAEVPTLDGRVERLLFRLYLLQAGFLAVLALGVIALLGVAFRPVPDLVIDQQGLGARMRPLENVEQSEPEAVIRFLETRLPVLYTWAGVLPNPDDPTGMTFIRDPGQAIELEGQQGGERIPTTVWNEQFILSESIRLNTLKEIAKLMGKTNNVVFQTDPRNPFMGVSYRFVFRGRPAFPKEVSPGRWKVTVNADIVRVSPTMALVPDQKVVQDFNFDIYVRRAGRNPHLFADLPGKQRDLVAWGKSSGFEIDWMTPFDPRNQTVPTTK